MQVADDHASSLIRVGDVFSFQCEHELTYKLLPTQSCSIILRSYINHTVSCKLPTSNTNHKVKYVNQINVSKMVNKSLKLERHQLSKHLVIYQNMRNIKKKKRLLLHIVETEITMGARYRNYEFKVLQSYTKCNLTWIKGKSKAILVQAHRCSGCWGSQNF